jgi:hypothetical protein
VFNPTGDWKSQQTQICVNIRMMQNRKYNETVDFMTKTTPSFLESMAKITGMRQTSNDAGNMDAVMSDSLRTANEMEVVAKNFETRMKSYDAYIEVMEANQKVVAQNALKGKRSLASDLMPGTAAFPWGFQTGLMEPYSEVCSNLGRADGAAAPRRGCTDRPSPAAVSPGGPARLVQASWPPWAAVAAAIIDMSTGALDAAGPTPIDGVLTHMRFLCHLVACLLSPCPRQGVDVGGRRGRAGVSGAAVSARA